MPVIAMWGCFAIAVPMLHRIDPYDYEEGRSRDDDARAARNRSAAALMLGEVRTAISDIMFIKTERYLHSGVAYVPHMEKQIMSVEGAQQIDLMAGLLLSQIACAGAADTVDQFNVSALLFGVYRAVASVRVLPGDTGDAKRPPKSGADGGGIAEVPAGQLYELASPSGRQHCGAGP